MIREVSFTDFNNPKIKMVAVTNPIRTNDAPRVKTVETILTGGARLGNGLWKQSNLFIQTGKKTLYSRGNKPA